MINYANYNNSDNRVYIALYIYRNTSGALDKQHSTQVSRTKKEYWVCKHIESLRALRSDATRARFTRKWRLLTTAYVSKENVLPVTLNTFHLSDIKKKGGGGGLFHEHSNQATYKANTCGIIKKYVFFVRCLRYFVIVLYRLLHSCSSDERGWFSFKKLSPRLEQTVNIEEFQTLRDKKS